ncbi:TPA: hypothetical protein ACH3X1_004162 [Trebouxia sp. C0004]
MLTAQSLAISAASLIWKPGTWLWSLLSTAQGTLPSGLRTLYPKGMPSLALASALYEHTQYLRRKKEALEMREAYESTADETGSSASLSQSSFSLKPGETITLKLAKTQLSPPASGTQPLSRLGSASAQLPRFQSATATSGQIPLLAPPPANSPGPTLARLSGAPGSSGKQTDDSADTDKASSSTADDATATASSAKHQEEGGMHDVSTHAEPGSAQDMHAQTDKQLQETASAEQSKQLNHMQPAIDDWGDFVS